MPSFGELWKNHPTISEDDRFPCKRPNGIPNFSNQCAIRMGTCLQRSHMLSGYNGKQCWYGHKGKGHTLRARELAKWMKKKASRFGKCKIYKDVTWEDFKGKHGFIFCENFWGPNNTGDHIDLWDGTGQYMGDSDFYWEGPAMASGAVDYIDRSEKVWFWQFEQ